MVTMALEFTNSYLRDALALFRYYKKLGEGAMAQAADEHLFASIDDEVNSIAITVKHMVGNMRSRWTDFLHSDGEKPDRNRDREFVMHSDAKREEVLASWERNWQLVFEVLNSLSPEDMERTVTIRGEPHSVLQAVNRQVAHYSYHIGQIVFLAKHWKGADWKTLSVARGESEQHNMTMWEKFQKP